MSVASIVKLTALETRGRSKPFVRFYRVTGNWSKQPVGSLGSLLHRIFDQPQTVVNVGIRCFVGFSRALLRQ